MPNENEAPNPVEGEPAEAPAPVPAEARPHLHELLGRPEAVVAKDPYYAQHEAAHAVTLDDGGWVVHDVNLNLRQTRAETKDYTDALEDVDLDDPSELEKHQDRILSLVIAAVAGYVAERAIGSKEPLVSEILAADEERLFHPVMPRGSDTNKAVHYLQRLWKNTVDEVVWTEAKAAEILLRRNDHLEALAKLLIKKRVVGGVDLEIALGKKPPKEEAASE